MTSSHNGHISKKIKSITDIRRQEVDEKINKMKTKVEEQKKTLETIDGEQSLLIQSGCDSYIKDVEKTSEEIHQIVNHYKHIEMTTAFDFRDTETQNLKGTRVFFQRLYNASSDRLLKFENLLQEPDDNLFFLEWKGLQTEYQTMTEESVQPLSSQRQMSSFNQDTFTRAIIDGIDKQFQMGLSGELQLKERKIIELLDENNKLKTEIKERNVKEVALLKDKETAVATLTEEKDILNGKLKEKQYEIDHLIQLFPVIS
ncbi:uncharacterized protein LOC134694296 [Mytilus trossulus]|uniref:uncharacterized protein LOC134694296 n=1 Tax=Mytilus trossulus TaxID=6551 RepID=UPI0030061AD2